MARQPFTGSGRPREGGVLATRQQNFISHAEGGGFRHGASDIDMEPPVDGYEASTLQQTMELFGDGFNNITNDIEDLNAQIPQQVTSQITAVLASVQMQNLTDLVTIDALFAATHCIYNETTEQWVAVGDNGSGDTVFYSDNALVWVAENIGLGNTPLRYVFAADGYNIILNQSNGILATFDGYREQDANDRLYAGIYDAVIDKAIVAGHNSTGAYTVFMTSDVNSDITTTDFDRVTISIPTLQVISVNIASDNNGIVVCLVAYRDGGILPDGRTDMYSIRKSVGAPSGIDVSTNTDVGMRTGTAGQKAVIGVAYDAVNNQWAAVTFNGEVWTTPAGSVVWTKIADLSIAFFRLVIVDSLWVSQGNFSDEYYYSIDGGFTWYVWNSDISGVGVAYSNKLKQFLFVNDNEAANTLSVGLTTKIAT